jgi:aspartate oxidase
MHLSLAQEWQHQIPTGAELYNQLVIAKLITDAALSRQESLGAHTRTDQPSGQGCQTPKHTTSIISGGNQ